MQKPVHFDVQAAESAMRQAWAEVSATLHARAADDKDRQYCDMQDRLFEIQVMASVRILEFHNEGADFRLVAQALGSVLAKISAGLILNRPSTAEVFERTFQEVFDELATGRSRSGTVPRVVAVPGMRGGNA